MPVESRECQEAAVRAASPEEEEKEEGMAAEEVPVRASSVAETCRRNGKGDARKLKKPSLRRAESETARTKRRGMHACLHQDARTEGNS